MNCPRQTFINAKRCCLEESDSGIEAEFSGLAPFHLYAAMTLLGELVTLIREPKSVVTLRWLTSG